MSELAEQLSLHRNVLPLTLAAEPNHGVRPVRPTEAKRASGARWHSWPPSFSRRRPGATQLLTRALRPHRPLAAFSAAGLDRRGRGATGPLATPSSTPGRPAAHRGAHGSTPPPAFSSVQRRRLPGDLGLPIACTASHLILDDSNLAAGRARISSRSPNRSPSSWAGPRRACHRRRVPTARSTVPASRPIRRSCPGGQLSSWPRFRLHPFRETRSSRIIAAWSSNRRLHGGRRPRTAS